MCKLFETSSSSFTYALDEAIHVHLQLAAKVVQIFNTIMKCNKNNCLISLNTTKVHLCSQPIDLKYKWSHLNYHITDPIRYKHDPFDKSNYCYGGAYSLDWMNYISCLDCIKMSRIAEQCSYI